MDTNEAKKKEVQKTKDKTVFLFALIIVIAGILIALKLTLTAFVSIPERLMDKGVDSAARLAEIFSTKENFHSAFGPIVSQSRIQRLQFFQRNQICFFRIIRYRSKDDKANHDHVEFYKKESDKKRLSELPIFLGQYCIWEAKGYFEFNFFVDMSNLDKWDFEWNKDKFTLTLYPPDIQANTPAELEPLVFYEVADSISINATAAKKRLQEAISAGIDGNKSLKEQLAEEQKKFFYDEARKAVKDSYIKFLSLIPNLNIEKYPEITVVFPHEKNGVKIPQKL